jgi:hypothetical protein
MWRAAVLIVSLAQSSTSTNDIIQKTVASYQQCSSYQDTGKVTTVFF